MMNTTVFEIPADLLKSKSHVLVKLGFCRDYFMINNKSNSNEYNKNYGNKNEAFLNGETEKMDNRTFSKYIMRFKDLFVIEVSILSDDSQYLRKEFSDLEARCH